MVSSQAYEGGLVYCCLRGIASEEATIGGFSVSTFSTARRTCTQH